MTEFESSAFKPDQGYAWAVAMACFAINFIMAGLARTAGVLYVALIGKYGVSREAATTPFSIRVCVRNMTGPLVGILGQRYGIRPVTALGGLFASVGSILCCFAPNIFWITIFWGLIHGFGFGLSTVIHMMIINQYFDKYKATALGVGYTGDSFGTFVFPVVIETLLTNYEVEGTFLILGGVLLNIIPLGLLLRKPPWLRKEKLSKYSKNITRPAAPTMALQKKQLNQDSGCVNEAFKDSLLNLKINNDGIKEEANKTNNKNTENPNDPPQYNEIVACSCDISISNAENDKRPSVSAVVQLSNICEVGSDKDTGRIRSVSLMCGNRGTIKASIYDGNQQEKELKLQVPDEDIVHTSKRTQSLLNDMCPSQVTRRDTLSVDDRFCTNDSMVRSVSFSNKAENADQLKKLAELSKTNPETTDTDTDIAETKQPVQPSMWNMFVQINTKPVFLIVSLTMGTYGFLFVGLVTVIIDYATDNGISSDSGKFLIIAFSVTDLIGRLSFGQLIDRKYMQMKNYACMNMILMGALVAVIPLYSCFAYTLTCMMLCGLVQGGIAIMFPILISQYTERHEESVAMGSLNFYGGLLMLAIAPMIGYFRDNVGSYNGLFYIIGILCVISGALWQTEPLLVRLNSKLKNKDQVIENGNCSK